MFELVHNNPVQVVSDADFHLIFYNVLGVRKGGISFNMEMLCRGCCSVVSSVRIDPSGLYVVA